MIGTVATNMHRGQLYNFSVLNLTIQTTVRSVNAILSDTTIILKSISNVFRKKTVHLFLSMSPQLPPSLQCNNTEQVDYKVCHIVKTD